MGCHRLRLNLPTTKQLTPSGETTSRPLARHGRSISMALRQLLLLTWDEARPAKSPLEVPETIDLFSSFRNAPGGGCLRANSALRNAACRHLFEQNRRARPTILPRNRRGKTSLPQCWQVPPRMANLFFEWGSFICTAITPWIWRSGGVVVGGMVSIHRRICGCRPRRRHRTHPKIRPGTRSTRSASGPGRFIRRCW